MGRPLPYRGGEGTGGQDREEAKQFVINKLEMALAKGKRNWEAPEHQEEYEECMFIGEDIPVAATDNIQIFLTDLGICQAVCEQDQALKVDDSNGDECVEENPPTNTEMRQALDILKQGVQQRSTNFKKRVRTI
ncbi:hypothetical protein AVEN_231298-1 [Araneus ventricosus]|uniref:Uncharacterized protein n=1 Tax=Araneus ventricosus TaxID=182803 RepID=A0A4Y2CHI6_ARAVE|nr:hypothetical protein AVEN_231298-1 [Araneus ventricosus]